ncbi:MAG TPA: SDR family oxidoreductase [Candidatus Dojkabacteria bacterium]|nr:SDR family oxidoreductase [Candidatus Dojkabacteria bacterium]
MELKGKNALVTGATKGIGKATIEALIKKGVNVAINYLNDEESAKSLNEMAIAGGVKAITLKADIRKESEVRGMIDSIRDKFETLDILVNNAGIFDENDGPENLDSFRNIFEMNFLAQVSVTNEALKLMNGGKIVFVTSIHGRLGHGRPDAIAYSSMKAGLDSYMKNLAKYLAPKILVNSIAPGKTITPMWGKIDEEYIAKEAKDHAIGRWIQPEEIADGVIFLVQNDSVCGEILTIDGGMSIKTLG